MTTLARVGHATVLAVLLVAPLGCREPTEAVLDITTDGDCKDIAGTGITPGPIGAIEDRPYATTTSNCQSGDIGSIVLLPPDGPKDAPFGFKVVTSLGKPIESCVAPAYGSHCIVARRAMRFVPHHAFHVPVRMNQVCAGVSCPEDQTCVDGICRAVTVDPGGCDDPSGCAPEPGVVPAFQKQIGGPDQQLARRLALGDDGTLAVTGNFDGDTGIDFGGGPLPLVGGGDIFLATFSPAGEFRWGRSFGGAGLDEGASVAFDAHSSLYFLGSFEKTVDFGGGLLASKGGRDVALVKLTSFGQLVWAIRFGGAADETPGKVAVDADQNVYVVGQFGDSVTIGSTTLVSAGGHDAFVASFDPAGNPRWARSLGGLGEDGAEGVGVDASNNLYVAGYFAGKADVGGAAPLSSAGGADVFVASFDPKGELRWAKSFGSHANDLALDLAARDDRIVVTGSLAGNAILDGAPLETTLGNGFVAAFETDGTVAWAQTFGGAGSNQGVAVAIAPGGSLVLGGATFGASAFNSAPIKPKGLKSPFVAVLERDGKARWAKIFSSSLFATTSGVGAPADGAAYVAGWFSDSLDADGAPMSSKGREDMMLLRVEAP